MKTKVDKNGKSITFTPETMYDAFKLGQVYSVNKKDEPNMILRIHTNERDMDKAVSQVHLTVPTMNLLNFCINNP